MEETRPVIRGDCIQLAHEFIEGVGLYLRTVVRAAVKGVAEIVDGFLSLRFAMNDGRNFKPDQITFIVVIRTAAPVEPASCSKSHAGLSDGGIKQWAPGAAGASGAKHSCDRRQ